MMIDLTLENDDARTDGDESDILGDELDDEVNDPVLMVQQVRQDEQFEMSRLKALSCMALIDV
jgi:hypothetical protein